MNNMLKSTKTIAKYQETTENYVKIAKTMTTLPKFISKLTIDYITITINENYYSKSSEKKFQRCRKMCVRST